MSSQKRLKRTPEGWSRIKSPSPFSVVNEKAFRPIAFLDLPPHLQRLILGSVPLRKLAQLACLNKELRAVYLERVNERDGIVADLLQSHFTAEFREGLSPAEMALPRDLIVDPPMSSLLQAAPINSLLLVRIWQLRGGHYQGFSIAGSPDGRGECRYASGFTYMGDWHKGHFHGRGTTITANGYMYIGERCKGRRQGQGTTTWASGSKYEGAHHNNERHGKGRYEWPDGRVYIGEWVNNKMHGKGRFEWPNGEVYVGEWVNDVKHGLGHQTLGSGESYFGDFKDGKRDGQGIVTYPDARKLVGRWKEGMIVDGGFA